MCFRPILVSLVLAVSLGSGLLGCQKSFDDRLAEVREVQEQGDFAGSIDRLRELASEQPDQAEVSFRLGLALANTGEVSASLWPLRKAAESPTYAVEAGLLLSRLLQQTGNHVEAIAAAEGVLAAEADHPTALTYLARAQILAKQHEEGLATAERVIAVSPQAARGYWLRGSALEALDRKGDAADAYAQMRGTAQESGEVPLVIQACSEEARLRGSELEQVDEAVALLESCIEDHPTSVELVRRAAQLHVENDAAEAGEAVWRDAIEVAPEALALRRGLAQHLAAEERWDEAVAVLEGAVDDFGTIEASNALVKLHIDRGDRAAAERVLASAAERLGDSDGLRFQRADLLLEQEDLDGAEALAGAIEDTLLRDVVIGRVQFFRGDYSGSVETLGRALERWPDNAGVRFVIGRAYQAEGNFDRALEEYRQAMRVDLSATDAALAAAYLSLAMGDANEALQYVHYHVRGRPFRNAEPYVIGARAAALAGRNQAAGELLDHLAAQEGGRPAAVAERARIEGESDPAVALGHLDEAGLDLTEAENEGVLTVRTDLLIRENRAEEALAGVDRTIAARPDAASVLALRAHVLQTLGRVDEARAAADAALAVDENTALALAVRGQLALAAGKFDEAIAEFDRAAAADENDLDSPYRAAQLEYASGRPDAARERLRALLNRAPAHVGASNDLAYMLSEDGSDLDEALVLAQRAARLSPMPEVVDTLAAVRIARGEESVAQEILERALEVHSESGTLQYRLGVAQEKAGNHEAALGSFRSALESGDFPQQDQARAEVARLEGTRNVQ